MASFEDRSAGTVVRALNGMVALFVDLQRASPIFCLFQRTTAQRDSREVPGIGDIVMLGLGEPTGQGRYFLSNHLESRDFVDFAHSYGHDETEGTVRGKP